MNNIEADQGRAQQVINLVFEFTDRYISPKEARQIDTLCQKRIEQVFEFLENEFGYFDEPNELAKIIIDDGGYYGSEGRMKKYLKFRAKYLAKIKEE